MRRIVLAVSLLVASTCWGCASNPTPHPGVEDTAAGGGPPMADGVDEPPDPRDEDGADAGSDAGPMRPALDAVSGDATADVSPDGGVLPDGMSPDGEDGPDAEDGPAGDTLAAEIP